MIREEECVVDFEIESTIRATHAVVPVKQFARKDGRLVDILEINSHKLADIFKDKAGFYTASDDEGHVMSNVTRCTSRGVFEAVYGAEQIIDIHSQSIGGAASTATGLGSSTVQIEEIPWSVYDI